jgi:hypothetical protein
MTTSSSPPDLPLAAASDEAPGAFPHDPSRPLRLVLLAEEACGGARVLASGSFRVIESSADRLACFEERLGLTR